MSSVLSTTHALCHSEWLLLDEINQMDGLERLIVLCVGLDDPIEADGVDTLRVRSVLYRCAAHTAADMNECGQK